jgi:hypothetical protein
VNSTTSGASNAKPSPDAKDTTDFTITAETSERIPQSEVKEVARALRKMPRGSDNLEEDVYSYLQWWEGVADTEVFNQLIKVTQM